MTMSWMLFWKQQKDLNSPSPLSPYPNEAGRTSNALQYELEDMETAILTGNTAIMKLRESSDVMDIMTKLRSDWGLFYPEEIHS